MPLSFSSSGIIIQNGKVALCCCGGGCSPSIVASWVTNYLNPTIDLTPYQGPGMGPHHGHWRLIEVGYGVTYLTGCIDSSGTLVGLPASWTSTYGYNGYMELQIGCEQPPGSTTIIYPNQSPRTEPVC